MLVYSLLMALITSQGRWQALQVISYYLVPTSLSWTGVGAFPTADDLRAKFEWWKYCAVRRLTGASFSLRNPKMVYAELMLQNLCKAAALPMEALARVLAEMHAKTRMPPLSGVAVLQSLAARCAPRAGQPQPRMIAGCVGLTAVVAAGATVSHPQLDTLKSKAFDGYMVAKAKIAKRFAAKKAKK